MKSLIVLVALTGCLDLHDNAYTCFTHDDCIDGESCNEDAVCTKEKIPDDLTLSGMVRDGKTLSIEVQGPQVGFGAWSDDYPQNLHMMYGSITPYFLQSLHYTTRPHPELTFPYVDVGSYDIVWASHRPPLHVPIVVTVTADAAPVISTSPVSALIDTRNEFDVRATDADDVLLQATVVGAPLHGTAETLGYLDVAYIPDTGYTGPDEIPVTVSDGVKTVTGVVHVDVNCGKASADAITTTWADTPMVDVRANDTFVGGELSITVPPGFGTASVVDDRIEYDPPRGYIGSAQFAYTLTRPGRCASTATVSVVVRQPVEVLSTLATAPDDLAINRNASVAAWTVQSNGRELMIATSGEIATPFGDAFGNRLNGDVFRPALSGDGRYVVFDSPATNVAPGYSVSGLGDVYLLDRSSGTTALVSRGLSGGSNKASSGAQISDDGLAVVFTSIATDLVNGDTNGTRDVFVRDFGTNTTTRVSVGANGAQANGACGRVARISSDGNIIAFACAASSLGGNSNGAFDTFVYDRTAHTTTLVEMDGGESVVLARDGRFVATHDALVDLVNGTSQAVGADSLSHDGRYRTLGSSLFDVSTQTSEDVCKDIAGNAPPTPCRDLRVSDDGESVIFTSDWDVTVSPPPYVGATIFRARQ